MLAFIQIKHLPNILQKHAKVKKESQFNKLAQCLFQKEPLKTYSMILLSTTLA